MEYIVIQSGSKGNATLVINEGRILLIDMGIGINVLKDELNKINKNIYNIDSLLLTHEHSDHTKGIKYLPPLPIYTGEGTYEGGNVTFIDDNTSFKISDFSISSLSTYHDVINPKGFIITNNTEKLVYITDTGKLTQKILKRIKNADYYIFESNHDIDMLMATNRPPFLKRRILSNKGHLSNVQSANYLSEIIGPKTKEIVLAHLSEEANHPDVALKTHLEIYNKNGIDVSKIKIICANQNHSVKGGRK